MSTKLLIDADSLIYKAGCANETREYHIQDKETGFIVHTCQYKKEADAFIDGDDALEAVQIKKAGPLSFSLSNAKNGVESILDSLRHTSYQLYIGGDDNFRYSLYPEYKANRKASSKPLHEKQLRDYLINVWGAEVVHGEEADDRVSYIQCSELDEYCIVAVDKDLWNTPGWHYNYEKQLMEYVAQEVADYNFWIQVLTGDPSDNIPGLKGYGPKKAQKILDGLKPSEWLPAVNKEYISQGYTEYYFVLMGR